MLRGNQRASRAAGAPCFNPCSTTNLTGATAISMTVPRSPHRGPRKLLSLVGHLALVLSLFGTAVTAAVPAFADSIVTPGALQLTQISNGPAVVGKPLSFTISTTNTTNGPINGVLLGASLPAGMPVAGILGPGGNPDLCARGGNAFSCSMGDLAPGASATASFSGTPPVAVTRVTVLAAATGCQGSPLPGGLNCATTGGHFVTTTSTLSLPVQTIAPPPGPIAVPIAATSVHAIAGNAQATVTWVPPLSNGGSSITSYLVTSNPPGGTATINAPSTIATLTGLTNGTTYTFTVTPRSAAGAGLTSAPSNSVTPTAPVVLTAPGAPTGVTATAGNASANVAWLAPLSTGGSPITSYTVTSSPPGVVASVPASVTSTAVSGLTNGTTYT
ncbi:MAG: fibronectin type III domain-containing protein, partial [Chloroflexi bacterium]